MKAHCSGDSILSSTASTLTWHSTPHGRECTNASQCQGQRKHEWHSRVCGQCANWGNPSTL